MEMASTSQVNYESPQPCPSWVFSNNSDVHVAKDRSWFNDDYIPFKTYATALFGGQMDIIGVGSVNLPVQTGPNSHGILHLKTVLHAPRALCNILGKPVLDELTWTTLPREDIPGCIIDPRDGSWVAYFKPRSQTPLLEVQLSPPPIGPEVGPSPISLYGSYMIHAFWPERERHKFQVFLDSRHTFRPTGSQPLNAAERRWMRVHFESEFALLQAHELSIDNEEDRRRGRGILRTLKAFDEREATRSGRS